MVSEARIGKRTISVWSIIAIVGGLFTIAALFLQWLSVSDFGGVETFKITGLDLISGKLNGTSVTYSFVSLLPLITTILGLAIVVISVLPTFIRKEIEFAYALTVVSAAVLALCIVFMVMGLSSNLFTGSWKTAAEAAGLTYAIGVGTVLATIGSIFSLVSGVLNIKEYHYPRSSKKVVKEDQAEE